MGEEIKKDDENVEKALIDEIAALDPIGDDTSLEVSTDEKDDDKSKTVDEKGEKKDETVDDDKKSVDKSEEETSDEKKEEKDTKASEEKKDETLSKKDEDEKSEKDKEGKKDISQVDRLLAEIDRLSGSTVPEEKVAPSEKDEKKTDESGVEKKDIKEDSIFDFIKDVDMDDVASDPKVFNKILHAVVARVQHLTTEQVLRSIPQVVMSQVQQQTYFKRIADKFYDDNKDLINVKQVVRACAQQVQKDNPEWEIEKVFTETAKKTRETLGMSAHTVVSEEELPSDDESAFAKPKGGSKSNLKQKKSSLQSEIDEL